MSNKGAFHVGVPPKCTLLCQLEFPNFGIADVLSIDTRVLFSVDLIKVCLFDASILNHPDTDIMPRS